MHAKSFQLCPILCDLWAVVSQALLSMGFSRQEILEWVAISSSRGSSQPRDWTHIAYISCMTGSFFTTSTTWENHYLLSTIRKWIYLLPVTFSKFILKESEKFGLKLNIQKTKIVASGPITSWQIDGEAVETVTDFILGGSKITADGDCSQEIKRRLPLGRKVMTNLDTGPSSQIYGFTSNHVWMWELDYNESWALKN